MKKTALLLAFLLLLGIFAGCKDTTDDTLSGSSDAPGSESDVSGDDTNVTPVEKPYSTVVSVGKSYTKSVEADKSYEDSYNLELTDGLYAEGDSVSYKDAKLSGYNTSVNVIIDLEEDGKRLYKFIVSYLSVMEAGIAPLASAMVYVSDDNEEWTKLGSVVKPVYVEKTTQQAVLELEEPIDARYVRFALNKASAWLFLDELAVIADVKGTGGDMVLLEQVDKSYEDDKTTNTDRLSNLNKVVGDKIDRSQNKAYVSTGCKYTYSYSPSKTLHVDDGKKLTDGSEIESLFEWDNWVGFGGGKELDIIITLKEERRDLAGFELSVFNRPSTGISPPAYVDVSVSTDNEAFTPIGRVYAPTNPQQQNFTYALSFDHGIVGKYVKFTLAETKSEWFLIEETAVYTYTDRDLGGTALYPPVKLPTVNEKTYWPSSTPDYKKKTNLIRGLTYQISSGVRLTQEEYGETNDLATSGKLTDGVYSNSTYYGDSRWFRNTRGASRQIYFDLTHTSEITGFKVNFLKYTSVGINLPSKFTLHLSDDGVNWYMASSTPLPKVELGTDFAPLEITLPKAVQARFARFSFDLGSHAYLDEIELFGSKFVSSSAIEVDKLGGKEEKLGTMLAPSEDLLGGVEDLLLVYYNTNNIFTKEVFLSYAGYTDPEGEVKDTMFDGFLFLPSTAALPSGGRPYADSVKSDWDRLLDQVFLEDYNLDALDKAVAEIKETLNMPDYKVKVYYTLLYPSMSRTAFGDVDGDGKSEDFSKLADRIKATKWYIEEFLKRYEAAGFENLELHGFYWFHETINNDEEDELTVPAVSKLVHDKGYQFFWIPYFSARGYYEWTSYGFDAACLQPNYAFGGEISKYRIATVADLLKEFNLCIEIELDGKALSDPMYYQRYMEYMKGGTYYGYMTDSIHMYYQGTLDIYRASQSKVQRIRNIYEYTYQFIKKTLNIYPDKLKDISIDADKDKIYEGRLFEADDVVSATVDMTAKNGSVTINSDGSFRYYPNKGFTGTDTFSFRISEGLDWSEPTVVTVNVK